jgi:hypothetical protein
VAVRAPPRKVGSRPVAVRGHRNGQ